jgi:hypothetical protein
MITNERSTLAWCPHNTCTMSQPLLRARAMDIPFETARAPLMADLHGLSERIAPGSMEQARILEPIAVAKSRL